MSPQDETQRMNRNDSNDTVRWNPYTNKYIKKCQKTYNPPKRTQTILPATPMNDDGHRWIGDDLSDPPNKAHTRVMLHNCNSLSKYLHDPNLIHSIMRSWQDMNFHIIALTETRINTCNSLLYDRAKSTYSQIFQNGEIRLANSPGYNYKAGSQPGGVGLAFNGRIQQRFVTSGRDTLGRWAWVQFAGKDSAFRIYTLYRVNYNSDRTTGHTTAWCQQREYLLNNNIQTNPRSQVISDIINDMEPFIEAGHNVLLLADLNESINGPEKTNKKLRDIGLINIMEHRIGNRLPLTHSGGSQAVDHMWGTSDVIDSVKQAGFAPFLHVGESDHRALLMDIDIKGILDNDLDTVKQKKQRRLKLNAPNRVLKYSEYIEKSWKQHKITKRIDEIGDAFKHDGPSDENVVALNKIDKQITEIMNAAEKRCTKMNPAHNDSWSVQLDTAAKAVYELKYQVKELKKVICGDVQNLEEQINDVDQAIVLAKEHYKKVKKEHKEHRNDHLDTRAKYNIDHKNALDIAKEIKAIKHIEEQIRVAIKIGYVLKPRQFDANGGILIPEISEYSFEQQNDPNFNHMDVATIWERIEAKNGKDIGRWERVTQKTKVKELLIAWQCKHFAQSSATPFVTEAWTETLMKKEIQDSIMNGSYKPPESLHPMAKVYLQYLKRDQKVKKELPFDIEFKRFCKFISKAKEKTSCSPSGRTYSHYKALLSHQKNCLKDIFKIIDIALHHSVVIDRWKHVTTTLLLKDAGQPKIHRMRTIHIIEAELQFISKHIYVQQMMNNAEQLGLITDEQYGGRKNRQAQSAVINKVLYGNISLQTRVSWACMDDDARACYDRILPCLSSVEGRKWGLSYKEAVYTTKVLHEQIFSIRTSTGVTSETYSYSASNPIQGAGQGIGWAGPKWINTSDTISRIMNDKCPGMKFVDPFNTICIVKVADFFIDDTATGTNENAIPPGHSVLDHLRDTEQIHADLLFVSGHRLALEKCAYYVIHFHRKGFKYVPKTISEDPGELQLRDAESGKLVTIQRLEPDEAHKNLGIHIAPSGLQKQQFDILQDKIKTWADRVRSSSLKGREKMTAYDAYLEKAILHIVSSTSFTLKQCKKLAQLISPILLHAHSIQRNCARIVLYSTLNNAGLNVTHIYHLQGLEKLKFFMTHLRRNDTTGKLMMISLLHTQLELGVSKPCLESNYKNYKQYVTPTWLTNLWNYCNKCRVKVKILNQKMYKVPRLNDFYLMDVVFREVNNPEHIHIFNHVRIALKLYTASDIVSIGSGATILPNVLKGINLRRSKLGWAKSEPIPKRWVQIWESILTTVIRPILNASPLGRWSSDTHQSWTYFTTPEKLIISDDTTSYVKTTFTRRGTYSKTDEYVAANIPCDVAIDSNNTIQYLSSGSIDSDPCEITEPTNIIEKYENIKGWKKRNWGNAKVTKRVLKKCIKLLQNNNLVACCDGSVNFSRSAHAWGLASKKKKQLFFSGCAPVDGHHDVLNSTRAEILGIIACVSFIQWISKNEKIQCKDITIFTDSEAAIMCSTMRGLSSTKFALYNDIDVILELQAQLRVSSHNITLQHVEGHQDKERKYEDLTPEAKLNVTMDKFVGLFIEQNPREYKHSKDAPHFPTQLICVSADHGTITGKHRDVFIDQFNENVRKGYMDKHFGEASSTGANWKHVARVLKTDKKHRSRNTKMIHNQYNTFDTCHRWNTSKSDTCPLCKKSTETWEHLPQCQHPEIRRVCNIEINRIRKDMRKVKTEPKLESHLLTCIRMCTEVRRIPIPAETERALRDAHNHQTAIKWTNFLKGIWSDKWERIQHEYYSKMEAKDEKLNIDVWSKRMVQTMFQFYRTLWKERCDINQAQKTGTLESRIRDKTYLYCKQIQKEIWKIHTRDRHLLRQNSHFFKNSTIQQILAWEKRVNNALRRERDERKKMNIKPNALCTPLPPRRIKQTTIINTMKRYRQTVLPFGENIRTSTSARGNDNTPTRTSRSMNHHSRREQRQNDRQIQQVNRVKNVPRIIQSVLTDWAQVTQNNITGRIHMSKSQQVRTVEPMQKNIIEEQRTEISTNEKIDSEEKNIEDIFFDAVMVSTENVPYDLADVEDSTEINDEDTNFEEQCTYFYDNIDTDNMDEAKTQNNNTRQYSIARSNDDKKLPWS